MRWTTQSRSTKRRSTWQLQRCAGSVLLLSVLTASAFAVAPAVGQAGRAPAWQHTIPSPTTGEVRALLATRAGDVVAEENPDQRMTPASVMKLVVAAAALELLGPTHRFRTEIYAYGASEANRGDGTPEQSGSVGSLIVVAGGDPSWNDQHFDDPREPMRQLAAQVVSSGVREVTSAVVIDTSRVVGRRTPTDWSVADASLGYGAVPSALAFQENVSRVKIAPGPRVGTAAEIEALDGLEWRNDSLTVPRERDGRGSIEFDLDWDRSQAVLRGEYPISEPPFTVKIATPNPDERAANEFLSVLGEAGVRLPPVLTLQREAVDVTGLERVAVFESPPLRDILVPLLADSSNFAAEMLLRAIAFETKGEGRLDLGVDALTQFLVERVGLAEDGFSIDDGSGLSPSNLLSPRAVVNLLQWAWQQPWREAYFESMASDRTGTIRDFWPRSPPVQGKTGTVRHTQCLAGVLLPPADEADAEPVFFAWMLNHSTRGRPEIRREIIDTLWSWSRR